MRKRFTTFTGSHMFSRFACTSLSLILHVHSLLASGERQLSWRSFRVSSFAFVSVLPSLFSLVFLDDRSVHAAPISGGPYREDYRKARLYLTSKAQADEESVSSLPQNLSRGFQQLRALPYSLDSDSIVSGQPFPRSSLTLKPRFAHQQPYS